jgi:hypothetical protein
MFVSIVNAMVTRTWSTIPPSIVFIPQLVFRTICGAFTTIAAVCASFVRRNVFRSGSAHCDS